MAECVVTFDMTNTRLRMIAENCVEIFKMAITPPLGMNAANFAVSTAM